MVKDDTPPLYRVPLIRRITELMNEKGDAYSIRAFATRIGISRETLRLCLVGERPINPSMLEKIALGLGVTVERLKQVDTHSKEIELVSLLNASKRTKTMMDRAYMLANELVEVAICGTERGYALHQLGRVQYLQQQYDDAHSTWLCVLEHAKKINEQFNDKHLLQLVTANLMLTYTIRKEYTNIEETLTYVETVFLENPEALGLAFTTRMRMQKDLGNLEIAKKHAYRSLEHFEQANNVRQNAHALINVAYCEYLLGDYKASARALSYTIKLVVQHEDILVIAVKNYIKTLIKLQRNTEAIELVEKYESVAKNYPEAWAKFQIMYSLLMDDPSYADRISNNTEVSLRVRFFACKCLFGIYLRRDDAESAMKYYKKGRIYSNDKTEFYEEEDF